MFEYKDLKSAVEKEDHAYHVVQRCKYREDREKHDRAMLVSVEDLEGLMKLLAPDRADSIPWNLAIINKDIQWALVLGHTTLRVPILMLQALIEEIDEAASTTKNKYVEILAGLKKGNKKSFDFRLTTSRYVKPHIYT